MCFIKLLILINTANSSLVKFAGHDKNSDPHKIGNTDVDENKTVNVSAMPNANPVKQKTKE